MGRTARGCGFGAWAIDHKQLADGLHGSSTQATAQLGHGLCSGLSVVALNANFDQFVRVKGAVGLGNDGIAQTGFAQHHYRVQVMSGGPECLALGGAETGWHPHRRWGCGGLSAVSHGLYLKEGG